MRLVAALLATLLAALPAAAQPRDPSFEIVNQSDRVVFQLFASPVTQRDWGRDHLGAAVLRQGQATQVRLPAEGGCMTDIRVVFAGGANLERRNVNTCVERRFVIGAQGIVAQAGPPAGPQAGPQGGDKTAGGPAPAPRGPAPAPAPGPAAGPAPGPAAGPARPAGPAAGVPRGNPSFWIVNNSRRTMRELYASPSSQNTWGPDRFGTGVLGGGDRFAVRLPEGECIYDVRVVWADGRPEDRRRINLCDVVELVFE
jgi:hypothetical protein